jgi:hypothetical protein
MVRFCRKLVVETKLERSKIEPERAGALIQQFVMHEAFMASRRNATITPALLYRRCAVVLGSAMAFVFAACDDQPPPLSAPPLASTRNTIVSARLDSARLKRLHDVGEGCLLSGETNWGTLRRIVVPRGSLPFGVPAVHVRDAGTRGASARTSRGVLHVGRSAAVVVLSCVVPIDFPDVAMQRAVASSIGDARWFPVLDQLAHAREHARNEPKAPESPEVIAIEKEYFGDSTSAGVALQPAPPVVAPRVNDLVGDCYYMMGRGGRTQLNQGFHANDYTVSGTWLQMYDALMAYFNSCPGVEAYDPGTGYWYVLDSNGVASTGGNQPNGTYESPYTDNTGAPDGPGAWPVDTDEPVFDCQQVKCPDPRTIIQSSSVINAAQTMINGTHNDGKERGAFLFLNADGTIRVGEVYVGTASNVPQLATAPANAIGSIHTHPNANPPSDYDATNAIDNHIFIVVATVSYLYIVDTAGNAAYKMRRPGSPGLPET